MECFEIGMLLCQAIDFQRIPCADDRKIHRLLQQPAHTEKPQHLDTYGSTGNEARSLKNKSIFEKCSCKKYLFYCPLDGEHINREESFLLRFKCAYDSVFLEVLLRAVAFFFSGTGSGSCHPVSDRYRLIY